MLQSTLSMVAMVAVVYGGLVAGSYAIQRKLIYFPDRTRPDPAIFGATHFQEILMRTEDGLDLLSWYVPPARNGAPVLVYLHGNSGHIGPRAAKIAPYLDAGYGALLVGYRGYGGNPGDPTEEGLYRDGHAAMAWLIAKGHDAQGVVLYGESLGTGVATELATQYQARALVLEAPFTSLPDAGARAYPFLPVRHLTWDQFDTISKMDRIDMPVMVLHGEADRVVPADMGRAVFDAAQQPKQSYFVPHFGHEEMVDRGAPDQVLGWLAAIQPAAREKQPAETVSP